MGEQEQYDSYNSLNEEDGEKELVGGTAEKRNWRGIIISLLVILLICSLIVVAIIIATPDDHVYENFSFDDIFDPQFQPKAVDAYWLTADEYILRDSTNNIAVVDVSSGEQTLLISNRTMDEEAVVRFWVKPDKDYILISTQEKQLYRSSFEAIYKIFDVAAQTFTPIIPPGETNAVPLRYVAWAPQGAALVFVYKNNLYYQSAISNDPVAVTSDGVDGIIQNAIPDWVYEEEILGSNNAIYWYEDGSSMVFATFNNTGIHKSWYPVYDNKIYSELEFINYPKPGFAISTFKLYVMSIDDPTRLVQLQPPDQLADQDYYYKAVVWKDRYKVAVTWMNRPQNVSLLTICQVDSGVCDVQHQQQVPNGWVLHSYDGGDIIFAEDGQSYFTILPQRESSKLGSFLHIAQIDVSTSEGKVTFLTRGPWEVTGIVGYNAVSNLLFYISTEQGASNRTLFSLNIETKQKTCISCNTLSNCSYFSAVFNEPATRYFLICEGPWVPQTSLHTIDSQNFTILENNSAVDEAFSDKDYVQKRFFKTKTKEGNYDMPIQLFVPRFLDKARKHPLLVDIYAGPESQMVNNKFVQGWYSYLSSNHHIIIARIDGRGSGFKGDKMMHEIYKKFGTVEIDDTITGVQYLLDENRFLDWNKTAIWGWSYGGTAATLAAARGVFNCTMAVAPVADWRFYDAVYTERYMGEPKATDNLQGYKDSNVSAKVSGLHNTKYMLVHGLADDNVHFQNSANIVKALVQERVTHEVQYYTDENHALADPTVNEDLYRVLTDFLLRCFDLKC